MKPSYAPRALWARLKVDGKRFSDKLSTRFWRLASPASLSFCIATRIYKVLDASGQSLAYVYGRKTKADADIAKVLTMDEARRIASNIAKVPTLLGKQS
jgi:hypothetical protein